MFFESIWPIASICTLCRSSSAFWRMLITAERSFSWLSSSRSLFCVKLWNGSLLKMFFWSRARSSLPSSDSSAMLFLEPA